MYFSFLDLAQTNISKIVNFSPLSERKGLPFPLYLNFIWRALLVLSFLLTLTEGAQLRKVIVNFVISPESKLGPINYMILVDQINGLFLGVNIIFQIVVIICPVPLSIVLGAEFCDFLKFVSSVYPGGSCIWGCFIALFRVLFIKGQHCLTESVGVRHLLFIMLIYGSLQIVLFAATSFQLDGESLSKKLCYHLSLNDLTIIQDYQVSTG